MVAARGTALQLQGLTKEFGPVPAVHKVDLQIPAGQLLALLGPSGSGKTTLLRLIAGLEQADHGRVLFGDVDAATLRVQDRRVGFMFQHYALFRHMTVADNVAFGLRSLPRARRPDRAAIQARVRELLDLMQIGQLEQRYPAEISGGQRQRVALARAMAIDPKVLLLDEPFGALDAQVRKDLRRWLREVHDRTGYTTLFVTHDQEEALELADRVVVMDRGQVQQDGDPDTVYDRPASAFVHSFIGESSVLPVLIREGAVWFGPQRLGEATDRPDGPAQLFVRPEAVLLAEGPEALAARILELRRHGPVRRLHLLVQAGEARAEIEVDVPADRRLAPGESIGVMLKRFALYPG